MPGALAHGSTPTKVRSGIAASALLGLPGCDGPLSALTPTGRDAEEIAAIFWWMAGAGMLIWLMVMGWPCTPFAHLGRIPSCSACHGPASHAANETYPILDGQPTAYLRRQLLLFAAGERGGTQ